jgi:hypothetical protein
MVAKSQLSIPEELASLKQYSAACALDVVITTKANLSTAATDEVTILEVDFIFSLLRRFECAARNLSRRSQTKILCLLLYLLKEIQQWWHDLVGTPRLSHAFRFGLFAAAFAFSVQKELSAGGHERAYALAQPWQRDS